MSFNCSITMWSYCIYITAKNRLYILLSAIIVIYLSVSMVTDYVMINFSVSKIVLITSEMLTFI